MANILITSLSQAIWDSKLISTRITLFLAELFWAIMLFWPGDTFIRPTYTHMSILFSENIWALIFFISSTCQLAIVVTDTLHNKFARIFAAWNASLWLYVVWSMVVSVYPPPAAIGGEISLTLAAGWLCIRPYILSEGYKRVRYTI